jgi:hypothetical protein
MPGYWRIYGRSDDQLMLSTGEKARVHRRYRDMFTYHVTTDQPCPSRCVLKLGWPYESFLKRAESMLNQDPHIFAVIMFGRGRFQNGVLIQPKEPFEPTEEALAEFRNKVWCVSVGCVGYPIFTSPGLPCSRSTISPRLTPGYSKRFVSPFGGVKRL